MVYRRVQLASGLHKWKYIILALSGEPQLTASPRAHAASRDSHLAAHGCRDVTDGASGSSAEPQGARSTSSRRAVGPRVFVYLVPVHTTATVSRGRSPGPLPGFGELLQVLVVLNTTRKGKGLT